MKNKHITKAPTMEDVAKKAGVSAMTVSRALKNNKNVSENTKKKILAAVKELNYVLDMTAGTLSSKKSGFVSVLIPTINNSNFSETVYGITEVLDKAGIQLLLGYTMYSLEKEEKLIETMLQRRPEALILIGGEHTQRARKILTQTDIPIIEMWDLPKQPVNHVVGFSNAATIQDMVSRLFMCGYRKIAFIGSDESMDYRGIDRRRGYEHAIKTLGLEYKIIHAGNPPISIKDGEKAVNQLIDEWPEVEAVICVSDLLAMGVIMECHRKGWKVPERLAVAGFGNFELSGYCWPSITTVSVNSRKIGESAGKLALQAIDKHNQGKILPSQIITIPHSILERESTRHSDN